jgi:hypothetical protein
MEPAMPMPLSYWEPSTNAERDAIANYGVELWVAHDGGPKDIKGEPCLWIWPAGYKQAGRWVPSKCIHWETWGITGV